MEVVLSVLAALLFFLALGSWLRERSLRRKLGPIQESIDALRIDSPRSAGESSGTARRGRLLALAASVRATQEALTQERRKGRREHVEREILLAHISDGVALLDRNDAVLHANQAFGALFGHRVAPEPGAALSDITRSPEVLDVVHAARSSASPIARDLRLRGAESRALEVRATHLKSEIAGSVLLVLRDLTERELQIRIRQDFVANVSHELRTPLTSIRGYAETLLDGGLEDEAHRRQFVAVIHDQATRLQELVEDLLSLAELERGGSGLQRTRFDLRDLARSQTAAFRKRAADRGLELFLAEGPPVEVSGDRSRIEQVFGNLLDNAIKYTETGRIRVAVGAEENTAWAEVEDTGIGIPEEERARIFERFYRVDKARSREQGGTGLGLSIVKHILAQHHGEISVESRPGGGSTFRLRLPR